MNILLFTKKDDFSIMAQRLAKIILGDRVRIYEGKVGDPYPYESIYNDPECVISFLSPWIIPKSLLDKAGMGINFHPGSLNYPGIGCYNFALYEGAKHYGATCHHMEARPDTGQVIRDTIFPIFETDTVESLKYRTLVSMLSLFQDILCIIESGCLMPMSIQWLREPFTKKDLENLKRITPDMSKKEVEKRIRATDYPGHKPYTEIQGKRFYLG
jgi:methionyl-tRNA formyltransferase